MRRLFWLLLTVSSPLFSDGGAVVLHRDAGSFVVTVFASPTPPRIGDIDLSILLQSSETLEPVLDADVQLELINDGSKIELHARRNAAGNKLLYSASVRLDHPGDWHYTASIGSAANVSGIIAVQGEQPRLEAYWGYLMLPFVSLAILALHQWLRYRKVRLTANGRFQRI